MPAVHAVRIPRKLPTTAMRTALLSPPQWKKQPQAMTASPYQDTADGQEGPDREPTQEGIAERG